MNGGVRVPAGNMIADKTLNIYTLLQYCRYGYTYTFKFSLEIIIVDMTAFMIYMHIHTVQYVRSKHTQVEVQAQ
jgi:hypothetical protein